MTTIITATNNALVARHITAITAKTGSALMGTSKALLIEEAKRQMRSTSGCRFIYAKKDGSGRGESPETWGCTCYCDMEKGGFRSFRWENLVAVLS